MSLIILKKNFYKNNQEELDLGGEEGEEGEEARQEGQGRARRPPRCALRAVGDPRIPREKISLQGDLVDRIVGHRASMQGGTANSIKSIACAQARL